ncbi:MAG: hypothetical protein N3F63_07595 [Thermoplasmata archaeon]|nr:hypothetical protein [Thermoplasmata archaeon]
MSVAKQPSPGCYKWFASEQNSTWYYLELSEGVCGIGQFFVKLYNRTGNATYLQYAEGGARWLISKAIQVSPDACKWEWFEGYPSYQTDKFGGVGAVGEFFLLLWKTTGNATYLEYSKKAANWLVSKAVPQYGGYKWNIEEGSTINFTGWAHGVAGVADFLRQLAVETGNSTYMEYAEGGARWLIAIAQHPAEGQYAWVRIETDSTPSIYWCGGTTGIVQFFVLMYETTGNATYLEYAKGGANWLISKAVSVSPGNTTFTQYYNIFCHGDPSTSYVMFMVYNATGNRTYLKYGMESANWTISTGIVVNERMMKWPAIIGTDYYETSLLRGAAGIGHQMLYAYAISGNQVYLETAKKAANWVGSVAVEVTPGVKKWNWEEFLRPDAEFYTGWYFGAAGIGLFFLEIEPFWVPEPYGVDIVGGDRVNVGAPGETVLYQVEIRNTGSNTDNISLLNSSIPAGWDVTIDFNGSDVLPDELRTAYINVTVPSDAGEGESMQFVLTAISGTNPSIQDKINITTFVHNPVAEGNWLFLPSGLLPLLLLLAVCTGSFQMLHTPEKGAIKKIKL